MIILLLLFAAMIAIHLYLSSYRDPENSSRRGIAQLFYATLPVLIAAKGGAIVSEWVVAPMKEYGKITTIFEAIIMVAFAILGFRIMFMLLEKIDD